MNSNNIKKLSDIAGMLLDQKLMELRAAAAAKAKIEAALAGLASPYAAPSDLTGVSGALALLTYARWADARRAEINQTLAQKNQQWLDARDAAKNAFGKTEALRRLSEKLSRGPHK